MIERHINFYSEGYKLDGTIYLPDEYQPGEKRPGIIPISGYQGFNEFYPRLFARYFTDAGYICLGFDYRGFAESEGEPGRVILDEQVQDIVNSITFMQVQDEVDPDRIGLVGWGMGASNAIRVAAADKRVKAVAGLNGFYHGERWLKSIHTYVEWHNILKTVEDDRVRRVTTGKSEFADSFIHYPLDPVTNTHVQKDLAINYPFRKQTQLQLTDSIIGLNTDKVVADIAPRPVFIGHGKDNLLHPVEESLALYEAAKEPKHYFEIDGKHNDFNYYNHPVFKDLLANLIQFFNSHLNVQLQEKVQCS